MVAFRGDYRDLFWGVELLFRFLGKEGFWEEAEKLFLGERGERYSRRGRAGILRKTEEISGENRSREQLQVSLRRFSCLL